MKISSFLSALLIAGVVGGAAQAAETSKPGTAAQPAFSWSDLGLGPWQEAAAARPAPAKAATLDSTVFPSLHTDAALGKAAGAGKDFGVNTFLTTLNLPQAGAETPHNAATASAVNARQQLAEKSDLVRKISEPASEVLMLVALASLAIAVRRRMPNERF